MGDEDNEHLRHLEQRLGQLTQLLIDAGERLVEERARNDALRLTLLRLIDILTTTGKLDPDDLRSALALAEIRHRADAKDPNGAAIADEIQQVRSELGRTLVPGTVLSRSVPETILHAARQTLPRVLAAAVYLLRQKLPGGVGSYPKDGADGGDRTRTGKPEGF